MGTLILPAGPSFPRPLVCLRIPVKSATLSEHSDARIFTFTFFPEWCQEIEIVFLSQHDGFVKSLDG
jgi:hypothetical protein